MFSFSKLLQRLAVLGIKLEIPLWQLRAGWRFWHWEREGKGVFWGITLKWKPQRTRNPSDDFVRQSFSGHSCIVFGFSGAITCEGTALVFVSWLWHVFSADQNRLPVVTAMCLFQDSFARSFCSLNAVFFQLSHWVAGATKGAQHWWHPRGFPSYTEEGKAGK